MQIHYVDPGELRLPPSRDSVDLAKLHRQFAKFGTSVPEMPAILVIADRAGVMQILDGVTRATRIHRFAPLGTHVPVIITEPGVTSKLPRVAERA